MRLLPNTLAVFWSRKGWGRRSFHADHAGVTTAKQAVERHRDLFPDDVIFSVRDARGRFMSFKQ